jgi:hypothetical protein
VVVHILSFDCYTSAQGTDSINYQSINYAPNRLGSLVEGDETPQSNLDAVLSTPQAPRTPATAGRVKPSLGEMHPSKVQHSTTQKPDSGLRLGFIDVNATGNDQPSGITQQTPSKTGISDTSFQFTFARPGPQLGPDAQRMMDELREEALKIKARLAAEREAEKRRQEESAALESRKIAQPKGKAGRFSDVHMAEFKKMDSIAGHASAFRAQPGRFTPSTNNLKRTQSKAQLDDRDEAQKRSEEGGEKQNDSDRLENNAPAKRARKRIADDTSSARPVSRGGDANKLLPATPTRSQLGLIPSLTTPTQASLARAVSTNKPASQIPTLTKSPSKPNLNETPRKLIKSATVNNISSIPQTQSKSFLQSPNKLDRVKSILRYTSSPKKPTSIPTLSRTPSKPALEKALPALPVTPGGNQAEKHVNFSPETVNKNSTTIHNSPSPVKSGIPKSTSRINFGPRNLGQSAKATNQTKDVAFGSEASTSNIPSDIEYPSLAGVRPLPEPPRRFGSNVQPTPSDPNTFTFRSDHTIKFGKSPKGFGSSPGQSSVRQVRQSFVPNKMPGTFPGNKENTPTIPSVPHGMPNKKRRRVESDDEEEGEAQRSPKKQRAAEGAMLMAPKLQGPVATPNATNSSPTKSPTKKKGVLSLSRLNMLARPKLRR